MFSYHLVDFGNILPDLSLVTLHHSSNLLSDSGTIDSDVEIIETTKTVHQPKAMKAVPLATLVKPFKKINFLLLFLDSIMLLFISSY